MLLNILKKKVRDGEVLWLVKTILDNHNSGFPGKGMPLGNWTSQFFANIYLNELDQFVKHELGARYYLRYVDDFVIVHRSYKVLQAYEARIREYLRTLRLRLHPSKCSISSLSRGTGLLGFRVFFRYRIIRERNIRIIWKRMEELLDAHSRGDEVPQHVLDTLQGWFAYAKHGNTARLRERIELAVLYRLENVRQTRI